MLNFVTLFFQGGWHPKLLINDGHVLLPSFGTKIFVVIRSTVTHFFHAFFSRTLRMFVLFIAQF